jgi:hypothetical protein
MRETRIVILSLALVTALFLALFINVRVYGLGTTIRVVPPPVEVREGEDFTVQVRIEDAVDMVAFQFKVNWDTQYLQYVSHIVYPPWPIPIVPDPMIGDGYIVVGAASMPPQLPISGSFVVATVTFHAVKSGSTYVWVSEPSISPNPGILTTEDASIAILPSGYVWVGMGGTVESYEAEAAGGFLRVFAVVDQSARGWSAFAVPPLGGPIIMIYPPPAFDFSLYVAVIVNASTVKLDYGGSDLWVSGLWRVANVTNPRDMRDFGGLLQGGGVEAYGELSVTGDWTYFTIDIDGYELIGGSVTYYHVRTASGVEDYQRYDLDHNFTVDMRDIGITCNAFGSTFGFERYDVGADTNFDLRVDMRDIGATASAFGATGDSTKNVRATLATNSGIIQQEVLYCEYGNTLGIATAGYRTITLVITIATPLPEQQRFNYSVGWWLAGDFNATEFRFYPSANSWIVDVDTLCLSRYEAREYDVKGGTMALRIGNEYVAPPT